MSGLKSYAELVLRAERGVDYDLILRDCGAAVTVLALHGGNIAPLTGELAADIAGETHNLYVLRGLQGAGSAELRLPTVRFAELRCDGLLSRSALALCLTDVVVDSSDNEAIGVGGANDALVHALLAALLAAGFWAEITANKVERLALQCYNRAPQGGAVLMLPWSLRQTLVAGPLLPDQVAPSTDRTPRWDALVGAVQQALDASLAALGGDLATALARFERTTRVVQSSGILGSGARRHDG